MSDKIGMTNGQKQSSARVGMINGIGRLNGGSGLIDGSGRINGNSGKINGCGGMNGLINGNNSYVSGLVNGYRKKGMEKYDIVHIQNSEFYKRKDKKRIAIETISVIAFITALLLIPLITTFTIHYVERITIDGKFNDWTDANVHRESEYFANEDTKNSHIQISDYAVDYENKKLSVYVKTESKILVGDHEGYADQINIFIDADGNRNTGYSIKGIGSEYRINAYGKNSSVRSSTLYLFTGTYDKEWCWQAKRQISTVINGNELETGKFINTELTHDKVRLVITVHDGIGNMAISKAFGTDGNILDYSKKIGSEKRGIIAIDGEFTDWTNIDGKSRLGTSRISIVEQKDVQENNTQSFYLRTHGDIFMGGIPQMTRINDPKSTGNDISDNKNTARGNNSEITYEKNQDGNDTVIVEMDNYRIIVKGIYDEIYQSELQEKRNDAWIKIRDVESASSGSEFETQIRGLNLSNRIIIRISDWRGNYDSITNGKEYAMLSIGNDKGVSGTDSLLQAFVLSNAVTIDGAIYTTGNEWSDADSYTCDLTKDMKVYAKQDGTDLYIAVQMLDDPCSPPPVQEYAEIAFDTSENGGTAPQTDDKKFRISGGNATDYKEGNGTAWVAGTPPTWSGKLGCANGDVCYEFQIAMSAIFGALPPKNKQVGFIAHGFDFGATKYHIWYKPTPVYELATTPTTEYCDNPSTWGDLQLPELSAILMIAVPIVVPILLLIVRIKRKGK